MASSPARSRPNGRSARVVAQVLEAAGQLMAEQGTDRISIGELSARSGVHHASIYRRWGSTEAVVLAVAASKLGAENPIPDTGSLAEDLVHYARRARDMVSAPEGLAVLKAAVSAADVGAGQHPILQARGAQIQVMLDRAVGRGEQRLQFSDIIDGILGPIYLRRVFGLDPPADDELRVLVTRLLAVPGRAD